MCGLSQWGHEVLQQLVCASARSRKLQSVDTVVVQELDHRWLDDDHLTDPLGVGRLVPLNVVSVDHVGHHVDLEVLLEESPGLRVPAVVLVTSVGLERPLGGDHWIEYPGVGDVLLDGCQQLKPGLGVPIELGTECFVHRPEYLFGEPLVVLVRLVALPVRHPAPPSACVAAYIGVTLGSTFRARWLQLYFNAVGAVPAGGFPFEQPRRFGRR